MRISKKLNVWIELRDIAILIILGLIMAWSGISCNNCKFNTREFWIFGSFTSLLWVVLWKGNEYLAALLSTKISWVQFPVKRFLVGLLGTIAFTSASLYIVGAIYNAFFNINISYGLFFSVIITTIISLFLHGRAFLLNWKQSTIHAERLQRENIAAQYEGLKNQVNPHFLFNSLNALSNLVYDDPDKAVKFIKQLSEVYRYVLDTRYQEIVKLEQELKFVESYTYLQQIRFGDSLRLDIKIHQRKAFVAPLALQMLIENAIKYNVVSADNPLEIKLYEEADYLVVQNKLQLKTVIAEPSAGVGLENIVKRYQLLTSKKVAIINGPDSFIVKLPLLESNYDSSIL